MSGKNAKLLRRIARRYMQAGTPVRKPDAGRWWDALSADDKAASRRSMDAHEARRPKGQPPHPLLDGSK